MPRNHRDSESYYELNWLGAAVYLGGAAIREAANFIDHRLEETAEALIEAERAFYDELDPDIEDARIVEEVPWEDAENGRESREE